MQPVFCQFIATFTLALVAAGCSGVDSPDGSDKPAYVQPAPKDVGTYTTLSADALVNVVAYHWKSHTVLDDVAVVLEDASGSTNGDKGFTSRILPVGSYQVSVTPPAASGIRETAIDIMDALAVMKLAIGVESINGTDVTGKVIEVSAYQRKAADFNADGQIDLKDAVEILKYSMGSSATTAKWQYFHDTETIAAGAAPKNELTTSKRAVAISGTTSVGIAAVLVGDVDGSWRPTQTTAQVDPNYYMSLVSSLQATDKSVTLARWGMSDESTSRTKIVVSQTYQGGVKTITYSDGSQLKTGSTSAFASYSEDGLFKTLTYLFSDTSKNYTTETVPLFNDQPNLLPELSSEYKTICADPVLYSASRFNNFPNVQSLVAFNMANHKDGKKDLAFTLWCGLTGGTVYTGPTPNGAVFFKQENDGSFRNVTKEKFGTTLLNMKGVAWRPIVYDFNKDGYDEVIWPVQGEDGRAEQPVYRESFFLTSNGDGNYTHTFKGSLTNSAGELAKVKNGPDSLEIATIDNFWRYSLTWIESVGYQWFHMGTVFMNKLAGDGWAKFAVSPGGPQLHLHSREDMTSEWRNIDNYSIPARNALWFSWQQNLGSTELISLEGEDYVFPQFEKSCELKVSSGGEIIAFFVLNANKLDSKYVDGQILVEGKSMSSQIRPMSFRVSNGKLESIQLRFPNWEDTHPIHELVCDDFNGDGNDDVLIIPGTSGIQGQPLLYLNDGSGNFMLVKREIFPLPPRPYRQYSFIYTDIDGDGIRDIVFSPLNVWPLTTSDRVNFVFYKGRRKLLKADLK